jgi:hypothetical protein
VSREPFHQAIDQRRDMVLERGFREPIRVGHGRIFEYALSPALKEFAAKRHQEPGKTTGGQRCH